jgi:hypothetical protein
LKSRFILHYFNDAAIETTFSMRWNTHAALRTNPTKLVIFKCQKAPRPKPEFNTDPPNDGKLQVNADPRMKEAVKAFRRRVTDSVNIEASYPTAVPFLMRGIVSDDHQLLDLERALGDLFGAIEFVGPNGARQTIGVHAGGLVLVVNMSRVLHDTVHQIVRDLDPRTESEKANGIIPRYSQGTSSVGN